MKFSGYLFFIILILPAAVMAQQNDSITLKASERYNKSSFYKLFFGEHYRKEWHTPVKFKIAYLDTLAGGLIPYKAGGGRQSKSLRLHDKNNREYVLRSIDKTFGKALPEIAQGTFIEDVIDDQVTIANPYAAVTIAPLAEAAGILHTKPKIYYIPKQKNLGEFNDSFGDKLYLFEQRPDEDWTTADNFANASNIIGTEKLYEKYLKDADNRIDQKLFLRSRLFDMLIGDWGRHDDQWRWAEFKKDGNTLYKPIPRDRDQAYTKFDGILLKILIPAVHAKHLQTFNYKIKDLYHYNFTARNLDHFFLNELTFSDWLDIANDIKYRLSDEIIDDAVKQLPPEVYNISGKEIAEKIKARRNDLPKYAGKYFKQVNEMVSIAGSKKKELFKINRLNDTLTEVKVYKIKDTNELVYSRVFNNRQTKELRIFGIDGNDKYVVEGNTRKGIKIRLIGGADKDIYNISSNVKSSGKQTKIYDSKGNDIIDDRDTKVNIYTENKMPRFSWEQYQYKKS
ncbi:MAG: metallophosphoesterase, partial [Bacteroidetes bacterium]|nr:metallophosphoesterase [Bacteroidota bacterium]